MAYLIVDGERLYNLDFISRFWIRENADDAALNIWLCEDNDGDVYTIFSGTHEQCKLTLRYLCYELTKGKPVIKLCSQAAEVDDD